MKPSFTRTTDSMNRARALVVATVLVLAGSTPRAAVALACEPTSGYSCEYTIEAVDMQKVPPFFKFQTRISQAKLPVGDVVFERIYVNVKRGETALCQESFSQVPVRDSVLNLEIGRTMDCDLGTIIANNQDLKFQICIGNQENCLKPVALSSVPYAVKSSYANLASRAQSANEAVQCHYAHRVAADKDLFTNPEIGVGYYDFYTPADPEMLAPILDLYSSDTVQSVNYENGGYIQWSQVDPDNLNLHICAKVPDAANGQIIPLDELLFHATKTLAYGQFVVRGNPMYSLEGDTPDNGAKNPAVPRGLIVERGMTASGYAYFDDKVIFKNDRGEPRTVYYDETHTLDGHGVTNFHNAVNVGTVKVNDDDVTEASTMRIKHWMTVDQNADFNDTATFNAEAYFKGPLVDVSENTPLKVGGTATFNGTSVHNGNSSFNDAVTVGDPANPQTLSVYNNTTFYGTVNIDELSGGSLNIPDGSIGNDELTDDYVLEVLGVSANGNLSGVVIQGITTHIEGTGGLFSGGIYGVQADADEGTAGLFTGKYVGISASAESSAGVGGDFTGYTGLHAISTTTSGTAGRFEGGFYSVEADGGYGGGSFTGDYRGISAFATAEAGVGIYGQGGRRGVMGLGAATGGAFKQSTSLEELLDPGIVAGVYAYSEDGYGGYFESEIFSGGTGVYGEGTFGIVGRTTADFGLGITGYGVHGIGGSGQTAVFGESTGTSNAGIGVEGSSVSGKGGVFSGKTSGVSGIATDGPGGHFRGGTVVDYHAPINIGVHLSGTFFHGHSVGDVWLDVGVGLNDGYLCFRPVEEKVVCVGTSDLSPTSVGNATYQVFDAN